MGSISADALPRLRHDPLPICRSAAGGPANAPFFACHEEPKRSQLPAFCAIRKSLFRKSISLKDRERIRGEEHIFCHCPTERGLKRSASRTFLFGRGAEHEMFWPGALQGKSGAARYFSGRRAYFPRWLLMAETR